MASHHKHLNLSKISSSWGIYSLRSRPTEKSGRRSSPHRLNDERLVRNVSLLLFSEDGKKLFLVKLRKSDKYVPPGGGIKRGEKPFDALKREFMEETGMTLPVCRDLHGYLGFSQYFSRRFSTKFYLGFCTTGTSGIAWRRSDGETTGSDWKSFSEILVERRHRIEDYALNSLTEILEELLTRGT